MAFYENTIVAKQDLAEKELKTIKNKYNDLINNTSGKVLNLAKKIKNYKKAFYIHYKFEGDDKTLIEVEKKLKVDNSIIRHLTVKYKKLDTKNEFFNKEKIKHETKK